MVELVQMEVQELLENNGFDADDELFVSGSALLATQGDNSDMGRGAIRRLMDVVDAHIEAPERDTEKNFLMPGYMFNDTLIMSDGTVVENTTGGQFELIDLTTADKQIMMDQQKENKNRPNNKPNMNQSPPNARG